MLLQLGITESLGERDQAMCYCGVDTQKSDLFQMPLLLRPPSHVERKYTTRFTGRRFAENSERTLGSSKSRLRSKLFENASRYLESDGVVNHWKIRKTSLATTLQRRCLQTSVAWGEYSLA